jgi:hypothetical protein
MELRIDVDRAQLARLHREFGDMPKTVTRILVRSINRTASTGKTRATRKLSKLVGLAQKFIRPFVKVRKASPNRVTGAVRINNKRFSLMLFRAKQTRAGVTYKSPTGQKLIRGAFIATMPSGKRDVFQRRGKPRLPIDKQKGPALVEVLANAQGVVDEEQRALGDILRKNVNSQIQFMLVRRANAAARAA